MNFFGILWEHRHTRIVVLRLRWLKQLFDCFFRDVLRFVAMVLVLVVNRLLFLKVKQGNREWGLSRFIEDRVIDEGTGIG